MLLYTLTAVHDQGKPLFSLGARLVTDLCRVFVRGVDFFTKCSFEWIVYVAEVGQNVNAR